ncbi:hypothetical protein K435DRAFT_842460 [Dendrothele bispora CBS 962.96]|uniref:Uncharacterized protein n=1 Tax=Dendrothele bispora (strain CBS 962.96) TaxID=1314807 RepID=A0A4V4HDN9_DENBC|nr:hypothetical protein K435DRAFT_842460 [Dendrothele bispora CBS 962.96]
MIQPRIPKFASLFLVLHAIVLISAMPAPRSMTDLALPTPSPVVVRGTERTVMSRQNPDDSTDPDSTGEPSSSETLTASASEGSDGATSTSSSEVDPSSSGTTNPAESTPDPNSADGSNPDDTSNPDAASNPDTTSNPDASNSSSEDPYGPLRKICQIRKPEYSNFDTYDGKPEDDNVVSQEITTWAQDYAPDMLFVIDETCALSKLNVPTSGSSPSGSQPSESSDSSTQPENARRDTSDTSGDTTNNAASMSSPWLRAQSLLVSDICWDRYWYFASPSTGDITKIDTKKNPDVDPESSGGSSAVLEELKKYQAGSVSSNDPNIDSIISLVDELCQFGEFDTSNYTEESSPDDASSADDASDPESTSSAEASSASGTSSSDGTPSPEATPSSDITSRTTPSSGSSDTSGVVTSNKIRRRKRRRSLGERRL